MKKIYFGALTLALCSASFAQNVQNVQVPLSKADNSTQKVKPTQLSNSNDDRAFVIWSDDFSSAATWTLTNISTPALDWSIETDPAVIPVTALSPFASATASNGYLFINSDGVPGNADGDGTPIEVSAKSNTTIDCSGEPSVKLRFSHNYRWWQDSREVRVSGDGGANWTTYAITDNAGYDLGYSSGLQNSENPQQESIDISAVAGNSNNVMIEFYYNDNDFWGWYWAVDDVEVIRTPDNDLRVDASDFGSVGPTSYLPYYMIPMSQIAPITFSARVTNIGLVDQTNTQLNVDVNTGANMLSSTAYTSVSNAQDSIYTSTTFTPTALGTYTFDISISTDLVDEDPTNNMIGSDAVEVTTYTYGRDDGTVVGSIPNVTSNTGLAFQVGNNMNIFADGLIGALDIRLSDDAANEGKTMYGAIYKLNAAGDAYDWVAQTDDYTIANGDVDNFVRLVFNSPINVLANDEILIVAGHYGDEVAFSYAQPAPDGTTLGFVEDGSLFNLTGAGAIMVRADMRDFTTVEENTISTGIVAYPNPANENVNIVYSVSQTSNVSINVTSITGDVVFNKNVGTVEAGEYNENIDVTKLANGVYFYTLTVNGNQMTKKLVVSKK